MADIEAAVPKPVSLTPHQLAALVLVESRIAALMLDSSALAQLGARPLSEAVTSVAKALKAGHEAYLAETQRAVSIAAPADIARLVKP